MHLTPLAEGWRDNGPSARQCMDDFFKRVDAGTAARRAAPQREAHALPRFSDPNMLFSFPGNPTVKFVRNPEPLLPCDPGVRRHCPAAPRCG